MASSLLACLSLAALTLMVGCLSLSPPSQDDAPVPLTLHPLFSDHMVLQRDARVPVWGSTAPGQEVTVTVGSHHAATRADGEGRWEAHVGPLPAGGPHAIEVTSGDASLILWDVLVGDVWLASGQSNMEWPMAWSDNAEEEIASASWPRMRLITIPHQVAATPRETVITDGWAECTPETVEMFSAVAYHFGRELHQDLGIPIGLINCSWGGTSMEAWTPLEPQLQGFPLAEAEALYQAWFEKWSWLYEGNTCEEAIERWRVQTNETGGHSDPGRQVVSETWASPDLDEAEWRPIAVPGRWEQSELPLTDGVVWLRRTIDLPAAWEGRDLALHLGAIDDDDIAFFNGVEVGRTGPVPNSWIMPRDYHVPAHLVRAGRCVIAVRVFDGAGHGGMTGPAEAMALTPDDDESEEISLAGEWLFRVAVALQENPMVVGEIPHGTPSLLYNAMLHPLAPFAMRGVIWYQGESNAARFSEYRRLSEVMIDEWRGLWGQRDLPFLLVQLAGFDVEWEGWTDVEWAQWETARDLPGVGMAVAADIGDRADIHPHNKREVGRRLALVARAQVYGEDVVFSGPVGRAMEVDGSRAILSFDHIGGGLVAMGSEEGTLTGFEIAGSDGEFVPAEARIEGDRVIVQSPDVPRPQAARYNWFNWPIGNLFNEAGLPAPLFRWEGAGPR
jgi:sialate O-acetylesterase